MGIKAKDALHVVSAIAGEADVFVTTDDRLLRKLVTVDKIKVMTPIDVMGLVDG